MIAKNCEGAGSKQEKSSANRASAAPAKTPVRSVRLVRSDKFSYFPRLSAWSLLTVLTEAHAGRLGLPKSSVCGCHWLSVKVSKSPRRLPHTSDIQPVRRVRTERSIIPLLFNALSFVSYFLIVLIRQCVVTPLDPHQLTIPLHLVQQLIDCVAI